MAAAVHSLDLSYQYADTTGPHKLAFEPKYLATSRGLSGQQNLEVVKALEEAIIHVAQVTNFWE